MLKKHRSMGISLIFFVCCVHYSAIDAFCAKENDPFTIAIFKEKDFPSIGTPEGLTPEWIGGHLKDYNIIYLNEGELKDTRSLNIDRIDLLILPYGEAVPGEGVPAIVEFIKDGGGLFTTGGRPFGFVLKKGSKGWEEDNTLDAKKYSSSLGISSYIIYNQDIASMAITSGISNHEEGRMKLPLSNQYGLCVKTSERIYNKVPTKGNVFPFRIPARSFIPFIITRNAYGEHTGSPLVLVKSWANPYRITERVPDKWCLVGFNRESHPLDPKDEDSVKRLREISGFLSTKVILTGIETDYASYKEEGPVEITAKILNYGPKKEDVALDLLVTQEGKILFREEKKVLIGPREEKEIGMIWRPGTLDRDFYEIKGVLRIGNKIIDEEVNGFTVWHEDELRKGLSLSAKDRRFYQGDEQVYLHGVNYYESKTGGLMWVRPNISDIEKDLKRMSGFGINFLRVHYHHPKWFRDYFKAAEIPLPAYFEGTGGMERSLRIMDALIILCSRHGIYFQPDIFTLVPEEMGDPGGWIGDTERCKDEEKIRHQKEFIAILSERYKNIPNITWDLWNEPFLKEGEIPFLKNWASGMVDFFRTGGDKHLITLGSDEGIRLRDELDYICGHGHDVNVPDVSKPFVMQEVWNESDLSPERENAQAEKLKRDFTACIEQGAAGFAPWQWTRQSCLWDDASGPETWDNELGLCVREDGSLKPAGKEYRRLIKNTP